MIDVGTNNEQLLKDPLCKCLSALCNGLNIEIVTSPKIPLIVFFNIMEQRVTLHSGF